MRVPWQRGMWRPLIRQRQLFHEQDLSAPGDWAEGLPEDDFPESFDEPLCDAPGFLDPRRPDEVSCHCELRAGHFPATRHFGHLPVRW